MTSYQINSIIANKYRLVEYLDSGSFSEVWKADDLEANIRYALKLYARLDENGIKEFKSEFESMYNLHHSNLLKATYFSIFENHPFLIMPLCQGNTFSTKGNFTENELWQIFTQTASALDYIHSKDIIHSDIKPQNILIGDNHYFLSDFGISTNLRSTMRKSLKNSDIIGNSGGMTPEYAAPEKFSKNKNEQLPIKANDIFSLGITIFELASGDLPFSDPVLPGIAILGGVEAPDLPDVFSKELNTLIKSCLLKETWKRPTAAFIKDKKFPKKRNCIKCNNEFDIDTLFCPFCGNSQKKSTSVLMKKCTSCTKDIKQEINFCPYCGANQGIVIAVKICKNKKCNTELQAAIKFWRACGTKQ